MNKNIVIGSNTYQEKIEECLEDVQNQIESSFNKIDNYLDSLLNLSSNSLNNDYQRISLSSFNIPKTNFDNLNFAEQLYKDIQPLIKLNINNQLKLKENLLQQSNQQIQLLTNKQHTQQSQTIQSNLKSFTYQLIPQCSISQSDSCYAVAMSKDCSTLLVGCGSQIKVFDFKQGIIKQTQILSEHKSSVWTLYFMKKSNQFISGSTDNSIIIWQLNQNNQCITQQILNGHSNNISCLILNTNEDLIVSGSHDNTIKFWIKKNEWTCQQTITDHSNNVYGLSFDQQQNRVVSCGYDKLILIMEQQGQKWIVIQKITVEQYGYRVCFIDNNMFTLSQDSKEQISVFEMNIINKQFTKTKHIDVKCGSDDNCLFPQQYINRKCILMSKNGQYVNLIRKKQDAEFVTEQSIHFNTNILFGGMSDDGEYLITWDNSSKEIQIRRYKEQ